MIYDVISNMSSPECDVNYVRPYVNKRNNKQNLTSKSDDKAICQKSDVKRHMLRAWCQSDYYSVGNCNIYDIFVWLILQLQDLLCYACWNTWWKLYEDTFINQYKWMHAQNLFKDVLNVFIDL